MRKFKEGDELVVVVDNTMATGLVVGDTYTCKGYSRKGWVKVEGNDYRHFPECTFKLVHNTQQKRDELKAAIELVQSHEICTNSVKGFVWKSNVQNSHDIPVEQMLDHIYPLETPAQKKLKELEEQQRQLADKMEKLRKKL